jgi:hypothetical protein
MELAFNVAWGPISQVAVPLLDVKTAVQLAVGAYGWWKARERSVSLVDMVQAVGGQLAPCTAFSHSRYLSARHTSEVRGIAWYDGRLEAFPLPRASTGNWGDLGLICLRAVTTALLALYDVESTTVVLTRIIPARLINYDMEDTSLEADGPFIACIRQFVDGVAAEEECNTLRTELWRRVDATLDDMLSGSIRRFNFRAEDIQEIEIPIVIGLLDWVLTSPNTRRVPSYPTRSLTAWSLAIMLSYLGFEIHASTTVLRSSELYNQHFSNRNLFPSVVYLVTYHAGNTDPLLPTPGFAATNQGLSPRRIVSIKAIPTVIFRHICYRYECAVTEVARLCEIWDSSFEYASSVVGPVQVNNNLGHIRLPLLCADDDLPTASESGCDSDYGPILHVLAPQLKTYLPRHNWTASTLAKQLETYSSGKDRKGT